MKLHLILPCTLLNLALLAPPAHAQVPNLLHYQGRIAVGTTNFNGPGSFKFALVNGDGTTTFWSNDGTSTAGSEPTAAVSLIVAKGLYFVLLGDTALANMTAVPASVFDNPDVRLRVWFNDGTNGSQLLTPDQRPLGVTTQDGAPWLHSFGSGNLFAGAGTGNFSMTGSANTGHRQRSAFQELHRTQQYCHWLCGALLKLRRRLQYGHGAFLDVRQPRRLRQYGHRSPRTPEQH